MLSVKSVLPGAIVSSLIAAMVWYGSSAINAPVMAAAIIVGLLLFKLYELDNLKPGIEFCAKPILYLGVALLGLKIDFMAIAGVGVSGAMIGLACLALTFFFGLFICKLSGIDPRVGAIMSGAVAVCGISAAAAICCVLPNCETRNRDLMVTIAGITSLSTFAMLVYPFIAHWAGLSDLEAGTFFGATIHNVSQVVGAGYTISEPAGDFSAFVKLVRVSALLPVILAISFMFRGERSTTESQFFSFIPPFLSAFFILALINSFLSVPAGLTDIGSSISYFCLVLSLVAIGMKTKFSEIINVGAKPFLIMTAASAFMVVAALVLIKTIGI